MQLEPVLHWHMVAVGNVAFWNILWAFIIAKCRCFCMPFSLTHRCSVRSNWFHVGNAGNTSIHFALCVIMNTRIFRMMKKWKHSTSFKRKKFSKTEASYNIMMFYWAFKTELMCFFHVISIQLILMNSIHLYQANPASKDRFCSFSC